MTNCWEVEKNINLLKKGYIQYINRGVDAKAKTKYSIWHCCINIRLNSIFEDKNG